MDKRTVELLINKYGSPLYVYDASVIRARCRDLRHAFPSMRFYYACKANTNPEIVRLIAKEGFDIETVSPGEIAVARKAGVPVSRISFTCSAISEKELVSVVHTGVRVHLDSLVQVECFGKHFPGRDISVRLNQGIGAGHHSHVITGGPDSKFGIDISELLKLRSLTKKYQLRITGLHQHIGSGIRDTALFTKAMDVLLKTALEFPDLKHLDFGGGFGVPYRPGERRLPIKELGEKVDERLERFMKKYGRKLEMSFEPGRYLVAESGNLLVTVVDIKKNSTKTFIGVDSGMNHLIRPAMYGSYHEVENISRPHHKKELISVSGNMCESGDILARDRFLPMPEIGDILRIKNAGAYGYTMSSQYNLRPRPAEVLLDGRKMRLVRKKG